MLAIDTSEAKALPGVVCVLTAKDIPGDINGDGRLSITDVTGIIEQLLDGGDIPAYCDVNGDGRVSITDVTTLIDMLLNGN